RTWEVGKAVRSLAFAPDGKTLATGDMAGTATLWDAATGRPVRLLQRGTGARGELAYVEVAFAADGGLVATADARGAVLLWEAAAASGAFDTRRRRPPPPPGGRP